MLEINLCTCMHADVCASIEILGTVYKKGSWLVTGSKKYCGVLHPQFSQVKDVLSKGENKTPLLIMNETDFPC